MTIAVVGEMPQTPPVNWIEAVQKWRKLTPEEQRRLTLKRLPRKVARSMAFEGEPVDQKMLEQELERLVRRRGF